MPEHTDIVELYPQRMLDLATLRAERMRRDRCHLIIRFARFSRTVYRPQQGPDMLMAHSFGETTDDYATQLSVAVISSRLDLYNRILQREPEVYDERVVEDLNLNPGWSWLNVADSVSRYVENQGYYTQILRDREPFGVEASVAFGKLTIMKEESGWIDITPSEVTEQVQHCGICHGNMTNDDSIALQCQHVFHKPCFFTPFYFNRDRTCPVCGKLHSM